ncbi:MAG TPA: hypothetical protein VIK18_03255 [Pirellulales bacterium]
MRIIILVAVMIFGLGLLPLRGFGQSGAQIASRSQAAASASGAPIEARPDGWRYRWHQGYWWYYTPRNTWLRYENKAWNPFIIPPPVPAAPIAQPAVVPFSSNSNSNSNSNNHITFGVDSS